MLSMNEKRDKNIIIRITEKEREELKKAAKDRGYTLSNYIRKLIIEDNR